EPHGIIRRKEFIHVPDLASEKAAAKAARAAVRAEFHRLKKSGVLAFELNPKCFLAAIDVAFDPLAGGLLISLSAFHHQPGQKILDVSPPWVDDPVPLDLGVDAAPSYLTFSPTGKWLAGYDHHLRVWDWRERKLLDVSAAGVCPVQFSPDEKRLLG